MRLKRDQITGIILILVGVVVFLLTTTFSIPITAAYPGPRMLPSIAAFGLVACGIGIFIESILSKKEEKEYVVEAGWIRIGKSIFIMAVYIGGMSAVGYLIATPIVLYVITTMFAKGSSTTFTERMLFSIIVTFIIYVVYVYAFGLMLPSGILFE